MQNRWFRCIDFGNCGAGNYLGTRGSGGASSQGVGPAASAIALGRVSGLESVLRQALRHGWGRQQHTIRGKNTLEHDYTITTNAFCNSVGLAPLRVSCYQRLRVCRTVRWSGEYLAKFDVHAKIDGLSTKASCSHLALQVLDLLSYINDTNATAIGCLAAIIGALHQRSYASIALSVCV